MPHYLLIGAFNDAVDVLVLEAVADHHEPRVALVQTGGELITVMFEDREALDGAGFGTTHDQDALAGFGLPIAGAVQLKVWLTALMATGRYVP